MREVLWVSPELPAVPTSGAALRSHRLIQSLTEQVPVRVLVVGEVEQQALSSSTGAQVEAFARPPSRAAKAVVAASRRWPTGTAAAWSAPASRRIADLAASGCLVIVDHVQMAPYLPSGRHVLSVHNAEAQLLADAPRPAGPAARIARRWDVRTTWALERSALDRAGLVVAVSDVDAGRLGGHPLVVPNGADLPAGLPVVPEGGTVLFVGALKYEPNREAVQWWADTVWEPGMPALTVVGSGSDHLTGARAWADRIDLVGLVPEVAPHLRAASVVAVPLLHGGGTRLKVLEALAWGRPVVSTRKGVEGLPVTDGQHVLLADDPVSFRDAVRRLLADPAQARALGARGRVFAEQFAWPVLTPPFVRAVTERLQP